MISLKDKVKQSPKVAFRVIEGEVIILTPHDSTIHTFNPVGTSIWKLLDNEREISEVVKAIREEYEVSQKEAEQDVLEFIEHLYQKKIVLINDKTAK